MKKITITLLIAIAAILSSCEGPMGPPGMPGQDGGLEYATIFEVTDDFIAPDYRIKFDFPNDFEIYDTDVVLVYILWELDGDLDIWRLMPQTVVLKTIDGNYSDTDVLQYNFDYTVYDVQMFLEGTIDFSTLLPAEWQNQTFRIAVVPADFLAKGTVDINDFNSILKSPELKLNVIPDISSIELTK